MLVLKVKFSKFYHKGSFYQVKCVIKGVINCFIKKIGCDFNIRWSKKNSYIIVILKTNGIKDGIINYPR